MEKPKFQHFFNENNSDTFVSKGDGSSFRTSYQNVPVTGELSQDTVVLGEEIVLKNQIFGQAIAYPDIFHNKPLDGVIGLAMGANSSNSTSILEALFQSGLISQKVASFYLTSDGDSGSYIVLGDIPVCKIE